VPTRLLLVDDDPTFLKALSEALYHHLNETVVLTTDSVLAALDLLREHDYHVIVSDLRLAGMDGMALLNQVRERWPDTPVVLMTGTGTSREADALMNGAVSFIEKPVDLDRLVPILEAAMKKSQMQRQLREENRESSHPLGLESQRLNVHSALGRSEEWRDRTNRQK
jgi:two-component system, NtrC family, response regulator GlrR